MPDHILATVCVLASVALPLSVLVTCLCRKQYALQLNKDSLKPCSEFSPCTDNQTYDDVTAPRQTFGANGDDAHDPLPEEIIVYEDIETGSNRGKPGPCPGYLTMDVRRVRVREEGLYSCTVSDNVPTYVNDLSPP